MLGAIVALRFFHFNNFSRLGPQRQFDVTQKIS